MRWQRESMTCKGTIVGPKLAAGGSSPSLHCSASSSKKARGGIIPHNLMKNEDGDVFRPPECQISRNAGTSGSEERRGQYNVVMTEGRRPTHPGS